MRIELYFELEKNIIPSDNRAMFVSFLKKTLEECNQGKYYEHYFTGTDRKDYCFVPLFDKPQYEKDKIILASPRLKLIFSASDKSKIGQIFYFAFIGMKHKRFPLPDQNSMILKKIVKVQEEVITSDKVIFRTVPGGGLIIREHFRENNTDNYYTINDKEFEEKAGDSLKRQAIYAGFAENEVQEIKIKTISGKKVVTRIYKQFIDISIGFFLIEAKPEILQYFLSGRGWWTLVDGIWLVADYSADIGGQNDKKVNDALFNTHVIPSDWRYSAAIVGLEKYLYNQNLEYEIKDEYFAFNQEDITRERFLEFAEEYYSLSFPHKRLEIQLRKDEFSQEEKKQINELLKSNAIMKKIFGKIKFDGDNKVEILECIRKNRLILTQETFRNKSDMYADFANPNLLFEEKRDCCRLWGYYIDGARKSKNLSFAFRTESFASEDCQLFDFIPFAFCGERESLFINDNYSVKQLIDTNQQLIDKLREEKEKKPDKYQTARKILFKSIQESSAFIDYDVEVMTKNRNRDFFETLYIRKRSIDILSELEVYEPFCFSVQLGKEYYLDVQKEVMDCILNLKDADELIEFFLKRDSEYLVSLLIKLNLLIKERGKNMTKGMTVAYACAKKVAERLPENKRKSYRQRLTSSLALKDYSAFLDILAQLSNYTDIQFDFVYDLFENFEDNKELAYTFANAMTKKSKVQDKQTGGKENE